MLNIDHCVELSLRNVNLFVNVVVNLLNVSIIIQSIFFLAMLMKMFLILKMLIKIFNFFENNLENDDNFILSFYQNDICANKNLYSFDVTGNIVGENNDSTFVSQ